MIMFRSIYHYQGISNYLTHSQPQVPLVISRRWRVFWPVCRCIIEWCQGRMRLPKKAEITEGTQRLAQMNITTHSASPHPLNTSPAKKLGSIGGTNTGAKRTAARARGQQTNAPWADFVKTCSYKGMLLKAAGFCDMAFKCQLPQYCKCHCHCIDTVFTIVNSR